ncbi:GntR family transcriptional regulator [Anaerorhabdus furcosa]|uniref:GntR family transcriptional regulator n=1 Tax=Anaerorhabdus furcosa TaxID=118967 RepID=A0A1T4P3T3_9FIRM|nr:GntR family transcriptional regulator [Anaerorhabdus furcosa]SJZ86205.1 GntR family transcriptional regulator [Anaerorhabdus furcosa]
MQIHLYKEDKDPFYLQIVKQIKLQILDHTLSAGDGLPSMRMLASDLRISVITTKRAYEELEKEGFIVTVLGKGTFVTDKTVNAISDEHLREFNKAVDEVLNHGKALQYSFDEIVEKLKERGK